MITIVLMQKTKDSISFGLRLKEARQRRRLSQKELAALVGLHPRQISKYETGTSYPTMAKLLEIMRALHTKAEELFSEIKVQGDEEPIQNIRLFERFKELQHLPQRDQQTVVDLIDAVIAKGKIRQIVGPHEQRREGP